MPVEIDPAKTFDSILEEVRAYLRDYAQLNRLLKAEETSDRQFRWFIIEVVDDFVTSPPPLGKLSITNIPRSILLRGVIAEALKSAAVLNLRNALQYTDGGFSVDLDKHREMLALAGFFGQEYEEKKRKWKIALNISRALGSAVGVHSEYALYSASFYGTYA